jgi:hypothetical protein
MLLDCIHENGLEFSNIYDWSSQNEIKPQALALETDSSSSEIRK